MTMGATSGLQPLLQARQEVSGEPPAQSAVSTCSHVRSSPVAAPLFAQVLQAPRPVSVKICGANLVEAVWCGRKEEVRELLRPPLYDANCMDPNRQHWLIHWAACSPSPHAGEIIDTLVTREANVDVLGFNNMSALHAATWAGNINATFALRRHGADVNAIAVGGWRPLHFFAATAQRFRYRGTTFDPLEHFISFGAAVNCVTDDGLTPLMRAAFAPLPQDNMTTLLNAGASARAADVAGWTALHYLQMVGDYPALNARLVDGGGDFDALCQTPTGPMSARDLARMYGRSETFAYFLQKTAADSDTWQRVPIYQQHTEGGSEDSDTNSDVCSTASSPWPANRGF